MSCAGKSAKRVFALDDPRIHPSSQESFEADGLPVKPGNDDSLVSRARCSNA
jgi:hypothetical protein